MAIDTDKLRSQISFFISKARGWTRPESEAWFDKHWADGTRGTKRMTLLYKSLYNRFHCEPPVWPTVSYYGNMRAA